MPSKKSSYQIWYEQVKRDLLLTEPQNIAARSKCCQNIVNECASHIHASLGLAALPPSQEYLCTVCPTDHLGFLLNWPGLRTDNSPKAPKTKKEYEKKSKNWLNGRRAPNYGKTLFPFFIADAERYVLSIAKLVIPNRNKEQRRLYCDILTYKILAQLCGCSVSLHEQAKKAPFFCKNSIERKGKLKEMLQSYATDHEYIQGFPSCFEEAIGYFDRKSNGFFREYKKLMGHCVVEDAKHPHPPSLPPSQPMKPPLPKSEFRHKNESQQSMFLHHATNNGIDADYWKKQFIQLRRELSSERQMRMSVERERDNLKSLIHSSTAAVHNPQCMNPMTAAAYAIPLRNDNSYDSLHNGSSGTVSTASSSYNSSTNVIQMQHPLPSYGVSAMAMQPRHSQQMVTPQPRTHCNPSTQMMQPSVRSVDAVHPYGPAMPSFVDACTNSNVYNLNNANEFVLPPSSTGMHPSVSNDAFASTIVDSMPIMNREQRSNDSYVHQMVDDNGMFFKSPAAWMNPVTASNETYM
eukprot:281252_1